MSEAREFVWLVEVHRPYTSAGDRLTVCRTYAAAMHCAVRMLLRNRWRGACDGLATSGDSGVVTMQWWGYGTTSYRVTRHEVCD